MLTPSVERSGTTEHSRIKARGAFVIGAAPGKNEEFVRSLGADELIDYT
jgi:hypothetical protein